MKQVKISENLFSELVLYHLYGYEESAERIKRALNEKMQAILRHDYFTEYKTSPNEREREEARRKYLERAGISPDFRW